MKRIRLLGLALIAVFALGAFASASAFAENPEILPVPSAGSPANFTSVAGEAKLVTSGGSEITCTKATNKGLFTSQDLGTVDITFEGCKFPGIGKCTSPGQAGGVILTEGDLHLVDVLVAGTLDLGVVITPHEDGNSKPLTFTCGGIATVEVTGAVIGVVDNSAGALLKENTKFKELKVLWKQSSTGEQEIKECMFSKAFCEGKKFLLESNAGLGVELAAEIADATLTFEKEYEVHF